jgi:predicted lactoylglutathione lyase
MPSFPFLVSKGAVAQRIRQHDRGATLLGEVTSCPARSNRNVGGDVGIVCVQFVLRPETIRDVPMAKLIFINLPVSDLARATAFYEAIGAVKNAQFSDDTASCMVFSDTIHAMLMTHDKYRQFTTKKIADAKTTSQVLICISADSRAEVDDLVSKAGSAGGVIDPSPQDDYDFMYGRSFEDLDGHLWGVNWMDFEAVAKEPAAPY